MASVKKNFLYQAFYEFLIIILPLITAPYISRVLGAEGIGTYSYTYTMANYFVLFCALGIKNYGNREISRVRDDKTKLNETFSGILFLHFIISGIVVITYLIYLLFIAVPERRLYVLIQGLYVVTAFFDISWFYFGIEQFKITVVRNTIIRILTVIFTFVFVRQPSDLGIYILILALGNFFSQMYLWLYLKRYVKICKVSAAQIFSHFPQMSFLFIPTVAISLYNYMDKIMVGKIAGDTELGFYENAEKLIYLASNVIGSVGTVMLPRMSNLAAKEDEEKARKYISGSMQIVMCMACAMAFGLASVAKVFSPIFWGEEYSPCAILVVLLAVSLPFKGYANVLRTQFLIPHKRDKEYTISVCVGAVVNLVFNLLLIKHLQAVGAAIGTIAAEMSVCVVQLLYCAKELPQKQYMKNSIVYFLPGIIMFTVVFLIGNALGHSILTLCIQVVSGVLIYSILCLCYFTLTKNLLFYRLLHGVKQKIGKR